MILLFLPLITLGQNRDRTWLVGWNPLNNLRNSIRFMADSAIVDTALYQMNFFLTNASICDSNGNILFYTNGQWVSNRNGDTLLSSENFNPGYATDTLYNSGLGLMQGAFVIPKPAHPNIYSLFYITAEEFFIGTTYFNSPLHLSYSEIDMNLDNGLGEMTLKNKQIIEDTLVLTRLTACKHANGRDWWVIEHELISNKYYKWLLTPDSLYGPFEQNIGQGIYHGTGGQSCFSPDASKYATVSPYDGRFDIFDFDRCTGQFFNELSTQLDTTYDKYWEGLSFSPSGRFLYVSSLAQLWQYDMQANNILSSAKLISVWDSTYDPMPPNDTRFFMHQLAPDGKIYISTYSGTYHLHVINNPDLEDSLCNFQTQQLFIPNSYFTGLPNYLNYDLGALVGSGCDTLNTPPETEFHFSLYPNPVSSQLYLTFHVENESKLKAYDVLGREVLQFTLYSWFKSNIIDVSMLPSGLYLYQVVSGEEELQSGKFVKVRAE